MTKQVTVLATLVACILLVPVTAGAQMAPGPKIGVVNFRALLNEAPQTQQKLKAVQDEFAQEQRAIEAKQKELKDRQAKLQKDLPVMGLEERRSAEAKFREDERELGRRINEFKEEISARQNEVLGRLQDDLLKNVQAFATAGGYDIVLSESGDVLHASASVNLTGKVLAAIQAKAKPAAAPAAKP